MWNEIFIPFMQRAETVLFDGGGIFIIIAVAMLLFLKPCSKKKQKHEFINKKDLLSSHVKDANLGSNSPRRR